METGRSRLRVPFHAAPRGLRAAVLMFALAAAAALPARAAPMAVVELDPAQTNISFSLAGSLHDTHGTFRLRKGTMRFDPATGEAGGLIVVDVTSGNTGNPSRDRKMRRDVLQSYKFGEAVFTPRRVVGSIAPEGSSRVDVQGVLRIHGSDHNVTMKMSIEAGGGNFLARTKFAIPYAAWGMKNPSIFLLSVAGDVTVEISAADRLSAVP